jgi:hypothetical protein
MILYALIIGEKFASHRHPNPEKNKKAEAKTPAALAKTTPM